MRLAVLFALTALTACKLTAENWPEKSGKAACDYEQRCNATEFYSYFESGRDCEDENLEYWEDYGWDTYGDCDFDEEKAKACLDAYDLSCKDAGKHIEDWNEDCSQVFECSLPVAR